MIAHGVTAAHESGHMPHVQYMLHPVLMVLINVDTEFRMKSCGGVTLELLAVALIIGTALFVAVLVAAVVIEVRS